MHEILSLTTSVCPVCLRVIPARRVIGDDGFIYLEKYCPDHGSFKTLIWEGSAAAYAAWRAGDQGGDTVRMAGPVRQGCPYDCGLCQAHENNGCCVLLELTNRCNLDCPVCFASAGQAEPSDMSLADIGALYDLLMARGGPFNIQLSGGEPTVRDDLPAIIALGREKGFTFFQLNTNGLRLAQEAGYAHKLQAAGLSCVFLQFDGLSDEVYTALRGRPLLALKKQAIENCAAAGLAVVLVPVIAAGVNLDALGMLLRFAQRHMPCVRGIHFQPLSYFGRCSLAQTSWRLTIPRLLQEIESQTGGQLKACDFTGGGAEHPYCSVHASYMRSDDSSLRALPRRRSQCSCVKASEARDFVARQWNRSSCCGIDEGGPAELLETSSLDAFLAKAEENTFTVSAMFFQDAYNLDLDRLRRCYVCEADAERGLVPFCAYNLTGNDGKALYRR